MQDNTEPRAPRMRTLLAARIIYQEGSKTLDCVIRNLSDTGAKLTCAGGVTIPDVFDLHIIQKNVTRRASLKWQHGNELGVGFLDASEEAVAHQDESNLLHRIRAPEAENQRLKARIKSLTEG